VATGGDLTSPDYWVAHLRGTVRFHDGVQAAGAVTLLEIGPDATLAPMTGSPRAVAAQRRDRAEVPALVGALAAVHGHGAAVAWESFFAPHRPRRVALPTYPFARTRYWLRPVRANAGQGIGHPILDTAVELPEGLLLTGALSLDAQPWLAGHAVDGVVLVPGTALLDLVLAAGARAGTPAAGELTLEAPLVLPERGELALQVHLDELAEGGTRRCTVHSRPVDAPDAPWTRHATGTLTPAGPVPAWPDGAAWPPEGAEEIDVAALYDRLAGRGLDYGPDFRLVRRAWRRGEDRYAEVELRSDPAGFALHPALFDSALHPLADNLADNADRLHLPFSWRDAAVHTTGATTARVRLSRTGPHTAEVLLTAPDGSPIGSVGALHSRPADLGAAVSDPLFALEWLPADQPPAAPEIRQAVLGPVPGLTGGRAYPDLDVLRAAIASGDPAPELIVAAPEAGGTGAVLSDVDTMLGRALGLLHDWLGDDALAGSRLAIVTRDATGDAPDLAGAALWGLLRAAQAEHPGRLTLIDVDGRPDSAALLEQALAGAEPQAALRAGRMLVPRLRRADPPPGPFRGFTPGGTVLVTGGTGALGRQVAAHLAERHGVRHLLLASRRPATVDIPGAEVTTAACDVADPDALAALLDSIPAGHPLVGVVHCAGVLDDATLPAQTPERVRAVLRPKADAAWHLHRLTEDRALDAFVLFSSCTATLGSAGQSNYGAANAFLDALAARRGGTARSLGWGLWESAAGMGSATDLARVRRNRVLPMSAARSLAAFDRALATPRAHVLPVRLDLAYRAGDPSAVLRGLIRPPAAAAVTGQALAVRLAGLPAPERLREVLAVVRAQAAGVLGHPGPEAVEPERGFLDMGFDSLMAVEFRNQLGAILGVALPATTAFDHPTPAALAEHLGRTLAAAEPENGAFADLERLAVSARRATQDDRGRLARRLRELLAGLEPDTAQLDGRMDAASDDEIFDFIDRELGV